MIHPVQIYHTILYSDIDLLLKSQLKPERFEKLIQCGYKYYFYDDDNEAKHDFEKLTAYFQQLEIENVR